MTKQITVPDKPYELHFLKQFGGRMDGTMATEDEIRQRMEMLKYFLENSRADGEERADLYTALGTLRWVMGERRPRFEGDTQGHRLAGEAVMDIVFQLKHGAEWPLR